MDVSQLRGVSTKTGKTLASQVIHTFVESSQTKENIKFKIDFEKLKTHSTLSRDDSCMRKTLKFIRNYWSNDTLHIVSQHYFLPLTRKAHQQKTVLKDPKQLWKRKKTLASNSNPWNAIFLVISPKCDDQQNLDKRRTSFSRILTRPNVIFRFFGRENWCTAKSTGSCWEMGCPLPILHVKTCFMLPKRLYATWILTVFWVFRWLCRLNLVL